MNIAQAPTVSEFIDVYTKYAVLAGVTSQIDSPLPGPFDVVAVGELVLGLIDATLLGGALLESLMEGIEITEYPLPPPTAAAAPAATAAPTASPLPSVDAPPVAVTHTRRYPNQTCEDEELDRLQGEKNRVCTAGYAAACNINKEKLTKIPCSLILLSLQQRYACLTARWRVQNECFDGKPDDGHKEQIDITAKGINRCEALKLIN